MDNNSESAKKQLITQYSQARRRTETICQPLLLEDFVIQSIPDVSPPKWHLAHTTWFFETFMLIPFIKNYRPFQISFQKLFNSYYHAVGEQFPRDKRGLLSRPSVKMIFDYRMRIDETVLELIDNCATAELEALKRVTILGIHHEQQHQELLLMDIKHNFSIDPTFPAYQAIQHPYRESHNKTMKFIEAEGGLISIGHNGNSFCFDNELPQHAYYLKPFNIANRLVTNGEYLEFILSGGYEQPLYWLADGWEIQLQQKWQAPQYWHRQGHDWYSFTLSGLKPLDLNSPVAHVSYYEADAFARWAGYRLPLETEWEHYVVSNNINSLNANYYERLLLEPQPASKESDQFFGDLWEWTASPYGPYPGFKPFADFGEYNGKFMNNQMVLRGGCCVTPQEHMRPSYRNFFQPEKRWQFSGIRLAKDMN